MAKILCLETATTNCSVALSIKGSVIAFRENNDKKYSHAEKLHVFIQEVLEEAGVSKNDLDAIAVSKGPGSYTGLRIGVSAAKGLAYAIDKPLISVPTLQSLAMEVAGQGKLIVSMLDARRMEVYSAVYNSEGTEIRSTRAEILSEDSFSEFIQQGEIICIGNGVEKFKPLIKAKNIEFLSESLPSALKMGKIAQRKFEAQDFEDVAYFEPYYLKDFIAG